MIGGLVWHVFRAASTGSLTHLFALALCSCLRHGTPTIAKDPTASSFVSLSALSPALTKAATRTIISIAKTRTTIIITARPITTTGTTIITKITARPAITRAAAPITK